MKRLRIPPFLSLLLAYAIVALILIPFPLVNSVGFEFSAVMGIVVSIGAGIFTISMFRRKYAGSDRITASDYSAFLRSAVILSLAALLLPVSIMTLNGFAVKNCNMVQGLAFVVLIPAVTTIFAVALAAVVALFARRAILIYLLILGLILILPLVHAYFEPQL